MATAPQSWTDKRMACIATYAILEGDKFLDQFDGFFLPFDRAGETLLTSLPYFPKFGASPHDIEGRADQMARKFFKFVVINYTNRKENVMDSVEGVVGKMKANFMDKSTTFEDLADVTDAFFRFSGE
jgi:hypothetical protein